jgi:signal transduction histidine kinase
MTEQSAETSATAAPSADRQAELAEIIRAYNEVTERLQQSHEALESEVLRLREELASTNAQLQRSKRLSALGEMAAGIAHEIRNPLGAIQLYANMAVSDLEASPAEPAGAKENLEKIAAAVRGLNGIVNDVLSFARELEPAREQLPVGEVFDRAVEAHRPAIDRAGASVARWDRERGELTVAADGNLLHQAVGNLVRNAVEAMDRGEAAEAAEAGDDAGRLVLDAEADDQGVTLTVRDTGPGIAEADVDRIFNPFFTTRNAGTGLGLAIVHRIVDAHGGTVTVHHDGGAVFQLSLPASGEREGSRDGE